MDSLYQETGDFLLKQQQLLDSFIKMELRKELQQVAGDKQKIKSLEEKLQRITVAYSVSKVNSCKKSRVSLVLPLKSVRGPVVERD